MNWRLTCYLTWNTGWASSRNKEQSLQRWWRWCRNSRWFYRRLQSECGDSSSSSFSSRRGDGSVPLSVMAAVLRLRRNGRNGNGKQHHDIDASRCERCVVKRWDFWHLFCCFWGKKRLCMLDRVLRKIIGIILQIQSVLIELIAYCTQLLCLSNSWDSWILVMPSG